MNIDMGARHLQKSSFHNNRLDIPLSILSFLLGIVLAIGMVAHWVSPLTSLMFRTWSLDYVFPSISEDYRLEGRSRCVFGALDHLCFDDQHHFHGTHPARPKISSSK